jgi:hypothetical protein
MKSVEGIRGIGVVALETIVCEVKVHMRQRKERPRPMGCERMRGADDRRGALRIERLNGKMKRIDDL